MEPETDTSPLDRLRAALEAVEAALDVDVVLYDGPVNEEGYGKFVSAAQNVSPDRKLLVIITTYGGSADSAYRMARYAQNYFQDFQVFVPGLCKSAGTLFALGASKIYMSPYGEFGPLDVQVFKTDEIFERRSGLLSKSAVWSLTEEAFRMFENVLMGIRMRSGGTISFRASSTVAASITAGLLGPVAAQLDPLSIGEDYQNLHIAHGYGERLVEKYGAIDTTAVSSLVEDYPSHGFVIDLFEATKLLGNVELASVELIALHARVRRSQRPHPRDVSVFRIRDVFGEPADDEAPGEDRQTTNDEPGDQAQRSDQPPRSPDRSSAPGEGGGHGSEPDGSAEPSAGSVEASTAPQPNGVKPASDHLLESVAGLAQRAQNQKARRARAGRA